MGNRLPPPDPHESYGEPTGDGEPVFAPTAVFVKGSPSPEADRLSDALLDFRPGLLIVLAPAA
jgi:hypothetical protein